MTKASAGATPAIRKKAARKKTTRKKTARKKIAKAAVSPDLSQPLVLPKALAAEAVPTLASAFLQRLRDPGASLELAGADVIEVDLAGLQVVLGLVNAARRQSRDVSFKSVSDTLRATAEVAGLAGSLPLTAPPTGLEEDDLCPVF